MVHGITISDIADPQRIIPIMK